MAYNTKPVNQQVFGTTPLDLKKINDNFSNLYLMLSEILSNSNSATSMTITNVEVANNALIITYSDESTTSYTLTKDEDGRITNLHDDDTGEDIAITYD